MLTVRPLNKEFNSGFQIIGHAEYAEHGADIVCSAVSAMSQMTEHSLKRYGAIISTIKPGNMKVNILNPNTYTKVLVESMLNGMRTVAVKYPEHVTIQEEQHDKKPWIRSSSRHTQATRAESESAREGNHDS